MENVEITVIERGLEMKKYLTLILAVVMVFAMTACGGDKPADPSDESTAAVESVELTQDEFDSLMWQIADQEETLYKEYVPDMWFADAEIFGVDKVGNQGTAYAMLCTDEYVVLKDKAYSMSGSQGEVIIKFEYTDEQPKLIQVDWSADGEDHNTWLEDNFPAEYLKEAQNYKAYDADGHSFLVDGNAKAAEKELGVPVETENSLQIDTDAGTYEIYKVIESGAGDSYKFDTETIETEKLADLK